MKYLLSLLTVAFAITITNAQISSNYNDPISEKELVVENTINYEKTNNCWGKIEELTTKTCCDITYTIYSVECNNGDTKYFYYFPHIDVCGTCALNAEGYYEYISWSPDEFLHTKNKETALRKICGCD